MKKVFTFAVTLLILSALTLPCFAQVDSIYIIDDADLISDYEEQYLLTSIENLQSEYGYDIIIHTTPSTYGKDIVSYCDDYYDNGGYAEDGLIFVISMSERDYYTSTCGTLVDTLPDYEIDNICTNVVPYLSQGDYFTAFETYLDQLNSYFANEIFGGNYIPPDDHYNEDSYNDYYEDYNDDEYYISYPSSKPNYLIREIVVIIIGVIVAVIITTIIKSKMNTAVKKSDANDYVVGGSFNISGSRDAFIGSHVSRRAIPKNNNTNHGGRIGGGGGGGHISSGGARHGGSGGKF